MSLCYRVAFNERVTTLKQQKRSGREREKLKQKDNLRSSEKKTVETNILKEVVKGEQRKTREKNNEKNKKKKWKIKRAIVSQYFTHACTISSSCWLTKFNVVFFYSLLHFGFSQIWKMNEAAYEANEWISKIHRIWCEASGETYVWNFQLNWNRTRDRCVAWWNESVSVGLFHLPYLFECENDVQCVTYSAAIQH